MFLPIFIEELLVPDVCYVTAILNNLESLIEQSVYRIKTIFTLTLLLPLVQDPFFHRLVLRPLTYILLLLYLDLSEREALLNITARKQREDGNYFPA